MAEEIKKHEEKPKGLTIEQMDAETKRIAYEAMDAAETEYNEAIKTHVKRMQEARDANS